jgi:hypothetical protein
VAFGFGPASGFRLPTSTLSGGPASSFGRISSVAEVAAWQAMTQPVVKPRLESTTRPVILGNLTIVFLSPATGRSADIQTALSLAATAASINARFGTTGLPHPSSGG